MAIASSEVDGLEHLVGSVPLADAETVFRTVSGAVGSHLSRMPDGETGERGRWLFFQSVMLRNRPAMEAGPTIPPFVLRGWDGGDRARIAAAPERVEVFGVSSECVWGRTDPARVAGLLESHRVAAESVAALTRNAGSNGRTR